MGKIFRNLRRSTKQYITVCVIAILVVAVAATGITVKIVDAVKTESENKLNKCYAEMNDNKRSVYRVTKDVMSGEVLTQDSIELKTVYATQPPEMYIDESDIGKVVLIDVMAGTQVLKTMVSDKSVDNDIREAEFNSILISSNMFENDVIDVRIAYPNGEDYAVLSKKNLKGYTGEAANCFLWLTEEEIIRTHNAIVDAYLYTGAYLYTTKYIEPTLQEATVVNYTPSVEAINLIQKNPNILVTAINELSTSVRKALENRLAQSMNKDVTAEQWSLESNYIYPENNTSTQEDKIQDTEKGNTDTTVIPSVSTETVIESDETAGTPEKTEFPETGGLDIDTDIFNGTNSSDLGKNTGTIEEEPKYETNYFMITEG